MTSGLLQITFPGLPRHPLIDLPENKDKRSVWLGGDCMHGQAQNSSRTFVFAVHHPLKKDMQALPTQPIIRGITKHEYTNKNHANKGRYTVNSKQRGLANSLIRNHLSTWKETHIGRQPRTRTNPADNRERCHYVTKHNKQTIMSQFQRGTR